jgi:hypothetical protein
MKLFALSALVLVLLLPACGGTNPAIAPTAETPLAQPLKNVRVFTNRGGASVLGFSVKASGDVAPAVNISGSKTQLSDPDSLAIDGSGYIYAANDSGTQVQVFSPGANGNAKPKRVIGGSSSHLGPTEGLLVDPSGNLWVSDFSDAAITLSILSPVTKHSSAHRSAWQWTRKAASLSPTSARHPSLASRAARAATPSLR